MMRFYFLLALSLLNIGFAQPSCETLLATIDQAFSQGTEVIMSVQIMQGDREFGYNRQRLFKNDAFIWEGELLERRGAQRPAETRRKDELGEEPKFELQCYEPVVTQTASGWLLEMPEQDAKNPIKSWTLSFAHYRDSFLPEQISGQIDTRIVLIPFKGTVNTAFSNWLIPTTLPSNPKER